MNGLPGGADVPALVAGSATPATWMERGRFASARGRICQVALVTSPLRSRRKRKSPTATGVFVVAECRGGFGGLNNDAVTPLTPSLSSGEGLRDGAGTPEQLTARSSHLNRQRVICLDIGSVPIHGPGLGAHPQGAGAEVPGGWIEASPGGQRGDAAPIRRGRARNLPQSPGTLWLIASSSNEPWTDSPPRCSRSSRAFRQPPPTSSPSPNGSATSTRRR